jgi:hypothetical protein
MKKTNKTNNDDIKRAIKFLEGYRVNRLDGPEDSFEGFVRAIAERDRRYSQLMGDLTRAKETILLRDSLINDLRRKIEGLESLSTHDANLLNQIRDLLRG